MKNGLSKASLTRQIFDETGMEDMVVSGTAFGRPQRRRGQPCQEAALGRRIGVDDDEKEQKDQKDVW